MLCTSRALSEKEALTTKKSEYKWFVKLPSNYDNVIRDSKAPNTINIEIEIEAMHEFAYQRMSCFFQFVFFPKRFQKYRQINNVCYTSTKPDSSITYKSFKWDGSFREKKINFSFVGLIFFSPDNSDECLSEFKSEIKMDLNDSFVVVVVFFCLIVPLAMWCM